MEKEAVYLVEVTFEAVVVDNGGTDEARQELQLSTEVATFKDFNKSEAKKRAQDFFDKTLRYGLTKSGGSIIKAIVPPNAIKNLALVDYNQYIEDMEKVRQQQEKSLEQVGDEIASEASAGAVLTEVSSATEAASVNAEG